MFGRFHEMKKTSFMQPDIPVQAADFVPLAGQAVPTSCNTQITPSCLMALYGTAGYVPQSVTKNSIGIAGYLAEFASTADLKVSGVLYLFSAFPQNRIRLSPDVSFRLPPTLHSKSFRLTVEETTRPNLVVKQTWISKQRLA
jgi:hypothetical protein